MIDFQKVFEFSPSPFLLISPELVIVGVNEAYLAIAKIKRNEIIGKHLLEVFPDTPNNPAAGTNQALKNSLKIITYFARATPRMRCMWLSREDLPSLRQKRTLKSHLPKLAPAPWLGRWLSLMKNQEVTLPKSSNHL